MRHTSVVASLVAALLAAGPMVAATAAGDAKDAPADKKPADKKADEAKPAEKKDEKPGDDKPFDEVVKDMQALPGLFTFHRRSDDGKILMEVRPEQLDKVFLFAGSVDQALGERGFYAAQMGADFPFTLRRVGKTVQWVQKNTTFVADEGTPAARATARSFPDSILGSAKVASKPHPERKSVLVDAQELFASRDLPGFVIALNQAYQPTSFQFDKERSGVLGVKAFPENVLLDVALHYTTDNPKTFSATLPDWRSLPLRVKYELLAIKQTAGFKPRHGDDRVGHFNVLQQDFTSDRPAEPYRRYITRWHLEKSDPAAVAPAKEPIVFWLENTIPVEYRQAMTDGILLWNAAFEKVGIKDALVVKQQPDDADWDPADTRYNTIRWFATVDAAFAIGPSRANPYTGQIYDADIGFSEAIIRNVRRFGEEFAGPVSHEPAAWIGSPWSRSGLLCTYASGLAEQAAFGIGVLETRGALTPEAEDKLMREFIIDVTAHEVGHTLGLRHNFRASTILKPAELHDAKRTAEVSQSSSVMDYNPIVLAGKGEVQGNFMPTTLGPYDYWAIEYAYKPIAGDERAELARIASRGAADALLPYSTDEDALGTFSPSSIDPHANQYDQTDDPLAYFRQRVALVRELWDGMETRLARPGEGYQILRRALGRSLGEYNRALLTGSKYIGGIHHRRDHVGDPGARPPYTPVPAARQKEALSFLTVHGFGEKSFELPASLHNRLAVERQWPLDFLSYFQMQRLDYPWHDSVLRLQRGVLGRLYNPITLGRIQDNELRFAKGEQVFRMADLFQGLDAAIWSELDKPGAEVGSLRRNLQREQLRQLIRIALRQPSPPPAPTFSAVFAPPPLPPVPEDATTLARASLVRIQGKARRALAAALTDATTRAHLQETQARIAAALDPQVEKAIE